MYSFIQLAVGTGDRPATGWSNSHSSATGTPRPPLCIYRDYLLKLLLIIWITIITYLISGDLYPKVTKKTATHLASARRCAFWDAQHPLCSTACLEKSCCRSHPGCGIWSQSRVLMCRWSFQGTIETLDLRIKNKLSRIKLQFNTPIDVPSHDITWIYTYPYIHISMCVCVCMSHHETTFQNPAGATVWHFRRVTLRRLEKRHAPPAKNHLELGPLELVPYGKLHAINR